MEQSPINIAAAHALAEGWKDGFPAAMVASEKIRTEVLARYGIDTHDVGPNSAYLETGARSVTTTTASTIFAYCTQNWTGHDYWIPGSRPTRLYGLAMSRWYRPSLTRRAPAHKALCCSLCNNCLSSPLGAPRRGLPRALLCRYLGLR